jgi:hypothetical protein
MGRNDIASGDSGDVNEPKFARNTWNHLLERNIHR